MTTYLLITAVVIFACVFLSKVSSRLGIPMLLAFILLGMLIGSDGILKLPFMVALERTGSRQSPLR